MLWMIRVAEAWFNNSLLFCFKQKTAYAVSACLVGSEMCIRGSPWIPRANRGTSLVPPHRGYNVPPD